MTNICVIDTLFLGSRVLIIGQYIEKSVRFRSLHNTNSYSYLNM